MDTKKFVRPGPKVHRARKASGNWNPDWEPFAKLDPAWTEKAIALAIAPAVGGALDAKTIELIGIALDASCTHLYAAGRSPAHPARTQGRRDQGGDHRGPAARDLAGAAQHVRRCADLARRNRSGRAAQG